MTKTGFLEGVLRFLDRFQPPFSAQVDPSAQFTRILVLRNNHIGDAVLVTPVIRDLKKYLPNSHLAVASGRWACDVFSGNPAVDEVIELNTPWGNKKISGAGSVMKILSYLFGSKEINKITAGKFDLAIEFSGHPLNRLLLWKAGIPYRAAMTAGGKPLPLAWRTFFHGAHESMGKSFLKSVEVLGFKPGEAVPELYFSEDDRRSAAEKMREAGFSGGKFAAVAPGAGWPESKSWLPERFAEVAGKLFSEKKICSLILGSRDEVSLTSRVAEIAGEGVFDLGGKLSLKEYFALVSMSVGVLCNNSSALHVAKSFKKPAVVVCSGLYGGWEAQEKSWGYPSGTYFIGGTKSDCDRTCARGCAGRECMLEVRGYEVFKFLSRVMDFHD